MPDPNSIHCILDQGKKNQYDASVAKRKKLEKLHADRAGLFS
jgi:hypothetical protein